MIVGGFVLVSRFGGPVAWAVEVFVFYQCINAMKTHRQVWAVVTPLATGKLDASQEAVKQLAGGEISPKIEPKAVIDSSMEQVGAAASDRVVAPLFWGALLGVPGALIYRITTTIGDATSAEDEDSESESMSGFARRASYLLNWIPSRMTALMSEVFREFRSLCKVARDAKKYPDRNRGWGVSALARAVEVRLDITDDAEKEIVINEQGTQPKVIHVTQALFWFWRITALSVFLALLAAY